MQMPVVNTITDIKNMIEHIKLKTGFKPNWIVLGKATHFKIYRHALKNREQFDNCYVTDKEIVFIDGVFIIVLEFIDFFIEIGFNPLIHERCACE